MWNFDLGPSPKHFSSNFEISLTPPPLDSLLRFWLPVDGFSRAIARLKAKSETNSVKESACSYLSSFRCEMPFQIIGHWRKTTELEFGTFWALASKRSIGWENGFQIWNQRQILYLYGEFHVSRRVSSQSERKNFQHFSKKRQLEFLRWLPTVEPKRSIGWENGGQIRNLREILG